LSSVSEQENVTKLLLLFLRSNIVESDSYRQLATSVQ